MTAIVSSISIFLFHYASMDGQMLPTTDSKRRETWAELITRAILSHPQNKMTINEIYAWMIKNVQVCQQTANIKSSLGWKNIIRHTLSVQPQFVRLMDRFDRCCFWTVDDEVQKKFILLQNVSQNL